MKLSLVVPCYNEELSVVRFFEETNKTFADKDIDYEFVFVDDGSKDKTYDKLSGIYKNYVNKSEKYQIQVLSFSRNFGKEAGIYAGLQHAKGDMVCIIDADLQQHPKVVLEMMQIMDNENDYDCVCAYQDKRKEGKVLSAFKKIFYKIINKISEVDFVNGASDFRLLNRKMVNAILSLTERSRFSKGIFSWVGFNTKYIPYDVLLREAGESKWNFFKLFKYAIDGIISFSTMPLKISTFTGFFSAVASIFYLIIVIIQKFAFGIDVPGYATIVVLLLFIGGLQLFSLGILGEYLAKVYIQGKERPIYILKEHLHESSND